MKPFLIFIAFVVLVSGIAFRRLQISEQSKINDDRVLSEESNEVIDEVVLGGTLPIDVTNTPSVTPKLNLTPTPTAAVFQEKNTNFDDFRYPGSEIVSSSQNSLSLKTRDNPDAVTSWYKDKITTENMNVKSFVTTKTNDKVLNRLSAAGAESEVNVEIKKDSGEETTSIQVTIY